MAVQHAGTLFGVPRCVSSQPGSGSGLIGPITLDVKCAGARSAGNPHATCDVAGAGIQFTVWLVRHSQRKRGATDRPDLRSNGASPRPYLAVAGHYQTGNRDCLASQRLPAVLELENSTRSAGQPICSQRSSRIDPTMSRENPLWGTPRIHGELLKLGIEIGETSVSKYMVRTPKPPSQTRHTFLKNHVKTLVSVDFFVAPTIRFQILYVFVVLAHHRRRIVHFAVTAHPSAEWAAQQLHFHGTPRHATCSGTACDFRAGIR